MATHCSIPAWESHGQRSLAMATHSSIPAWEIPWAEEPGNGNPLQYSCLGIPWAEEPGRLHILWHHKELDTTCRLNNSMSQVGKEAGFACKFYDDFRLEAPGRDPAVTQVLYIYYLHGTDKEIEAPKVRCPWVSEDLLHTSHVCRSVEILIQAAFPRVCH